MARFNRRDKREDFGPAMTVKTLRGTMFDV
jgi:hypothetical protein